MKKAGPPKRPPRPLARLPLPKKTEKRHGDASKYSRRREKDRLRRHAED